MSGMFSSVETERDYLRIELNASQSTVRDYIERMHKVENERDALRAAWLRVIQAENTCIVRGVPCHAKRCGCAAEQEMLIQEATE